MKAEPFSQAYGTDVMSITFLSCSIVSTVFAFF